MSRFKKGRPLERLYCAVWPVFLGQSRMGLWRLLIQKDRLPAKASRTKGRCRQNLRLVPRAAGFLRKALRRLVEASRRRAPKGAPSKACSSNAACRRRVNADLSQQVHNQKMQSRIALKSRLFRLTSSSSIRGCFATPDRSSRRALAVCRCIGKALNIFLKRERQGCTPFKRAEIACVDGICRQSARAR